MPDYILDLFDKWLKFDLGIQRNYVTNLKSLNKYVLPKLTGYENFILDLYEQAVKHGYSAHLEAVCNLVEASLKLEKKNGLQGIKLSAGTFNDCMSAFRKYCWFLRTLQTSLPTPEIDLTMSLPDIVWSDNPRKEMNADFRLKTQNRLNQDESKKANFPAKLIDQIANNASKWADACGLPSGHPARNLKGAKEEWLDNLVNKIVFLIEDGKQVRFEDIDKIGTHQLPDGGYHVYIMIKKTGSIHRLLTRKKDGSKELMVLPDEKLSNIAIDHIYRMEDLLKDLQDAFPFLKKITALFRTMNAGDIRSAETLQAVRQHIENNFLNTYADDMAQLIKELKVIENVISLEAITKKDNLEKH